MIGLIPQNQKDNVDRFLFFLIRYELHVCGVFFYHSVSESSATNNGSVAISVSVGSETANTFSYTSRRFSLTQL